MEPAFTGTWCSTTVAKVELIGLQEEKVWIELSNTKLATLGIPLAVIQAALDEQSQQLFWQHVERWQAAGRTLLLVSHNRNRLSQRLDNALLIARSGCIFAPLRQLLGQGAELERVA